MNELLTADLPGTGGEIKLTPEDFRVEEIPRYLPCGEGEHLYLTVEKTGLTTFDLLRRLSEALGVPQGEFGYAGLKDARAVTCQTVSVPHLAPEQVTGLQLPGVRILAARRHGNKLRLGHLAGNRFEIRLRAPAPGALQRAEEVLAVLQCQGVPNRFGVQRYGVLGNSHRLGRALLRQDYSQAVAELIGDPQQIRHPRWRQAAEQFRAGQLAAALELLPGHCRPERSVLQALLGGATPQAALTRLPRKLLRLYLSAYQSHLFDRLLVQRLPALGTLQAGDWAYKHANGACFLVEQAAAEQPRADAWEISPTAPLFGSKVRLAAGAVGVLERALLTDEGLGLDAFRLSGGLTMPGERRPLRVPLAEARVTQEDAALRLNFALPAGSFATSVLQEVMKVPARELPTAADG